MNKLLSYVAGHLLTIIEMELASHAPEIVALAEKEVQLLITKLQHFISKKAAIAAPVVNPLITDLGAYANNAINSGLTSVNTTNKS